MTAAAVLRCAADIVGAGWTQGSAAATVTGAPCSAAEPAAVAWCALGAMSRANWPASFLPLADWDALLRAVCGVIGPCAVGTVAVARWNDAPGRTAAEVATALREAACRAG